MAAWSRRATPQVTLMKMQGKELSIYNVALPLKPGAALVRSDKASLTIRNIPQPHQVQVQPLAVKGG